MFDVLTGRGQPTEESIKRLERFVYYYCQLLRNKAECVPSYLTEQLRRKQDRVLDLLRGWRLS